MANVADVAAYVVNHFDSGISTMKLQKLCYIAQGWSLALRQTPLFAADFEAWRNGPVSRTLFGSHKGKFVVNSWPSGNEHALTRDERIIVDAVLEHYDALSGLQLSELTHQPGTPWSITRDQVGAREGESSDAVISQDLIKEHFTAKLLTGSSS